MALSTEVLNNTLNERHCAELNVDGFNVTEIFDPQVMEPIFVDGQEFNCLKVQWKKDGQTHTAYVEPVIEMVDEYRFFCTYKVPQINIRKTDERIKEIVTSYS